MFTFIDNFLDRITMYRLVLYELIGLLIIAAICGFLGFLPYSFADILYSSGFILFVCLISNKIFSYVFEAPTNVESVYITALILSLIITPVHVTRFGISIAAIRLIIQQSVFLGWAGLLSMASKYIFAIGKKHLFNPVAIAVVLTAFVLGASASWWVGTAVLMPFVAVFGLLIVRKIQREDMLFVFFLVAMLTEGMFTLMHGGDMFATLQTLIFRSSLLFFGFVMLTEPLTTPPTKKLQLMYGGLVGLLFSPHVNLFGIYSTPELALVVGNVFSYFVSPKEKLYLHLKEKLQYGVDIIDFVFAPVGKFNFTPGQYLEWTLPHDKIDTRGNRRYFTIASSPTEESVHLGVKFNANGSSFKRALARMDGVTPIVASQLAGDFTLPSDQKEKLVFIAGGIGITPFRSMIKYCVDTKQNRSIVLFYANKLFSEIAYADVFEAARTIGIRTVYTLTDTQSVPSNWRGRTGRVTKQMIEEEIPDYRERTFYLSGPHAMVTGFEETLHSLGVSQIRIKKDFFPGFV
ncbi:MAG: oxidoreductase [Patescibacteria group bacterium]|nr:oxidoreductase [Patescibacteria group bacterium]